MKNSLRILFYASLLLVSQVCTSRIPEKEKSKDYFDDLYARAKEKFSLSVMGLDINLKNIERIIGVICLAIIVFTFYYLYSWVVSIYKIVYFFVTLPLRIFRFFIYIMCCGFCCSSKKKSVQGSKRRKESERQYREREKQKERERIAREQLRRRQRFDDDSDDTSSYSYGTRSNFSGFSNYSSQYSES